jgi:ribosomal protein L37AE/L43A
VIELSLTAAIILYSSVLSFTAFGVWFYTEFATRRVHQVLEQQHLWRCVFCSYTYLDEAAERISRCPRCDSFNSIEDAGARLVAVHVRDEPTPPGPEELPRRNPSKGKRPGARRRGPRRRG